jgi:hypothetical protein
VEPVVPFSLPVSLYSNIFLGFRPSNPFPKHNPFVDCYSLGPFNRPASLDVSSEIVILKVGGDFVAVWALVGAY